MGEQHRQQKAKEGKTSESKGRKGKPGSLTDSTPAPDADALASLLPQGAAITPAGHLSDARVKSAQRQALAGQIGRLYGNRHLQQLVVTAARQPLQTKGEAKTSLELLREALNKAPVDPAACLNYISLLGADAAAAAKDQALMARMAAAFNAKQMLDAVQRLGLELKWAIHWLNRAGAAGGIGTKGYDALFAGATAQHVADLIGWAGMLNVVKANYAGNPLTMFPSLIADDKMLAQVMGTHKHFVDWVLDAAGAPQLLQFMLRHSPRTMIAALVSGARWATFLSKLPKGMGLTPTDKAALRQLALSSSDVARQMDLFDIRFDVLTRGTGGIAWETKGLMRAWQIVELLPAADVEGNPNLTHFLRAGKGFTQGESDMSTYVKYWYDVANLKERDIGTYTDPKDPMYRMNVFDGTIIHEIGHAVDGTAQKYSKAYPKTEPGGGWKWYTPEGAVDAMLAAAPTKLPPSWIEEMLPKGPEDIVRVVKKTVDVAVVLTNIRKAYVEAAKSNSRVRDEANAIDPKGGLWKLMRSQTVAKALEPAYVDQNPWMNHGKQVKFGDRYFHEGYPGEWYSYLSDRYDAKLSKYQFRDPSDWFAETYTCYYITVDPANPKSEDAGKKVPEPIRTWFRTTVAKVNPPPVKGGP